MKFYKKKDFKKLSTEWKRELKKSGFADIEKKNGLLKVNDHRTAGFHFREEIANFFTNLGHFLAHTKDIPPRARAILELYVEGTYINIICKRLNLSDSLVRNTIRKYKKFVLSEYRFSIEVDSED